jgi:hypothetical protein
MAYTIHHFEQSLGFRWEEGFSRQTKESSKVPVLKEFLKDIRLLNVKYMNQAPKQLKGNNDFKNDCEELFSRHGPQLWPCRSDVDTSARLVDANTDDWQGKWTRNLAYDEDKDREVSVPE